jgi:hypothetical protein
MTEHEKYQLYEKLMQSCKTETGKESLRLWFEIPPHERSMLFEPLEFSLKTDPYSPGYLEQIRMYRTKILNYVTSYSASVQLKEWWDFMGKHMKGKNVLETN